MPFSGVPGSLPKWRLVLPPAVPGVGWASPSEPPQARLSVTVLLLGREWQLLSKPQVSEFVNPLLPSSPLTHRAVGSGLFSYDPFPTEPDSPRRTAHNPGLAASPWGRGALRGKTCPPTPLGTLRQHFYGTGCPCAPRNHPPPAPGGCLLAALPPAPLTHWGRPSCRVTPEPGPGAASTMAKGSSSGRTRMHGVIPRSSTKGTWVTTLPGRRLNGRGAGETIVPWASRGTHWKCLAGSMRGRWR